MIDYLLPGRGLEYMIDYLLPGRSFYYIVDYLFDLVKVSNKLFITCSPGIVSL